MDKTDFYRELIRRYKNKTATDDELEVFFQLVREGKLDALLADEMDHDLGDDRHHVPIVRRRRRHYIMAAVLLLGLGIAYTFYSRPLRSPVHPLPLLVAEDVPAGGNRATLTLPDGSRIALDDARIGAVAETAGVRIDKTKDGQLVYHVGQAASPGHSTGGQPLHAISTPRGGQYQVVLPDGSDVWLNADSRLRFPPVFTAGRREVYLEGEGLFDVAHADQPFIVHTAGQQVQVLGTAFNIRAYAGEPIIQTTLLRGSVAISPLQGSSGPLRLKPNQQAVLNRQTLAVAVANVNAQEYASWKNGYFTFANTALATVMQDIARWYDVTIDVDHMPNKKLYAVLPRDVSLATLLEMIDMTSEIKFELKERRVRLVK
ncbi:FecR domain-containing protein [Parapedobacter sp. ISTM3]|nr:FecR family protein [Parapedobacter sp. ISTM3]MBK1440681.1 FecR domain-containing protein [Parapedobacter sp. ISTM3]